MSTSTVSAKELKNRTGEVLRRVREGEKVIVLLRGKAVARFVRVEPAETNKKDEPLVPAPSVEEALLGKYRGLVTVDDLLKEKAREKALERGGD